jgi:hypothetical protein
MTCGGALGSRGSSLESRLPQRAAARLFEAFVKRYSYGPDANDVILLLLVCLQESLRLAFWSAVTLSFF